jgi:hypothetical protein
MIYYINQKKNNFDTKKLKPIRFNFFQLWCLFNEVFPLIKHNEDGTKIYEYRIEDELSNSYKIYSKNTTRPFIKETNWFLAVKKEQVNNKCNSLFIQHVLNGLHIYKEKYACIERHVFQSDDEVVNNALRDIRRTIVLHRETLKSL